MKPTLEDFQALFGSMQPQPSARMPQVDFSGIEAVEMPTVSNPSIAELDAAQARQTPSFGTPLAAPQSPSKPVSPMVEELGALAGESLIAEEAGRAAARNELLATPPGEPAAPVDSAGVDWARLVNDLQAAGKL